MSLTGDRIREMRLLNHLTLDDVAKRLCVGRQAVYKYENGTVTNIPLENLEIMAKLFNTSPEYLAGWSDDDSAESADSVREQISDEEHILFRLAKDAKPEALRAAVAVLKSYEETNDDF